MRTIVIDPPSPVVSWEEADQHLGLEGDTSQKSYVEALIAAATGHIDGPDGWLGRAIGPQTLECRFDLAPGLPVRLPYPPVIEVEALEYVNAAGTTQAIPEDCWELFGSVLEALPGIAWPFASEKRARLRVRYQAGYEELPAAIRAAILLMVGDLFRFRDTVALMSGSMAVPMSTAVEALLGPFRIFA